MSTVTPDIVQKLWNLCNILKDDGVTFYEYVTELTYLLFLKMAEETDTEDQLPEGHRWSDISEDTESIEVKTYNEMLNHLSNHATPIIKEIFTDAHSSVKKDVNLRKLITDINKLNWYDAKQEDLGNIYEGLLERNANEKKSGAGQYFTPRSLIDSIVRVMQPSVDDVIQDPAAGTGGFLISADRYIKENDDSWKKKKRKKYSENTFYGLEHVQDTYRLALMNLMLHGIEFHPDAAGIHYGDTLGKEGQDLPKATLILSNPPFGSKSGGGLPSRDDFDYSTSNKQLCFLQHIYQGLNDGGRAAVILPDNVLFEGNIGKQIRADLMDKCNLHTILKLPTGIFYAPVKTNVLFFTKVSDVAKDSTEEVWFYDMRANMPNFGKRTQLTEKHFEEFEKVFGVDPEGNQKSLAKRMDEGEVGRFRCFSRDYIAERNESLDINWLRDDDSVEIEDLLEPAVLAQSALVDLEAAISELLSIIEDLDKGGAV